MKHSVAPPRRIARLEKLGQLVIAKSECSSNLWGYLCDRYGVSPADTLQLILEPPATVAAERKKGAGA